MKKKHINIFIKFIGILCFLIVYSNCSAQKSLESKTISITREDGTTISLRAELAQTQEEKSYGFMNRTKISEGTGMLFIFSKDQHLSFWMKDTPTPLSIAYIDSKGTIREIYDMTPYSLNSIVAKHSVRYALEVPQNWFRNNNITINSKINVKNLYK